MAAAAIVLALVAGVGVYMYAAGADRRAQDNASFVDAYVANADIAKGTTGAELIQASLITKEKVAKGSIPPGAITDLSLLRNLMTAGPISTKQFITTGSFVSAKDGGGSQFSTSIAAQNLVAVTVTVDADHGVANQIAPGDHVDIAVPTASADGSNNVTYSYMLGNVKVLAVGASTAPQSAPATSSSSSSAPPPNAGVLTFEVSKDDALRIISANSGSSKLYLVLLPPSTVPSGTSGSAKAAASSK